MPTTYIICQDNRVTNSPFFMGDTDQKYDIVTEYPLPCETDTIDKEGNPVRIRFIAGCNTIIKEEQVNRGWPEKRKPTESERQMLTFLAGMLTVPDEYKVLDEYLQASPWWLSDEEKADPAKRRPRPVNARIIFERFDQQAIDNEALDFEEKITDARNYILKAEREDLVNIYRLAKPGGSVSPQIDSRTLKLNLLALASENPELILKGMKGAVAQTTIMVSKAVDYGVLNIDTLGKVFIIKAGKQHLMANISDIGGRAAKQERICDFLTKEENKNFRAEVTKLVKGFEKAQKQPELQEVGMGAEEPEGAEGS